jgi:hypothetical protein
MTSDQKMHSSAAPRKRQERETSHNYRLVDLDEADRAVPCSAHAKGGRS